MSRQRSDFGFFESEEEDVTTVPECKEGGAESKEIVPVLKYGRSASLGEKGGSEVEAKEEVPQKKYGRSTSIDVRSGPTSTGLSFVLNMDEEKTEQQDNLHDDIAKMFDSQPRFSLDDLLSGSGESRPSERGQEVTEIPRSSDRFIEEYDIKSHRRASFPHTHVPLKSLHNHSSKNLMKLEEKQEEVQPEEPRKKKKKRSKKKKKKEKVPKKSKSSIFPSKAAMLSPAIPEVEKEEYSQESASTSEEDSADENTKLLDDVEPQIRKPLDDVDAQSPIQNGRGSKSVPAKLGHHRSGGQGQEKEAKVSSQPGEAKDISITITDVDETEKHGLFYIGSDLHGKDQSTDNFSQQPSEILPEPGIPGSLDSGEPIVSTKFARLHDDLMESSDKGKVKFLLGMEDDGLDEEGWAPADQGAREARMSPPPKMSPKASRSDRHRHRKHQKGSEHYGKQDLLNRRQKGSDVHLSDMASMVHMEGVEDMDLRTADLDEMASHRMENLHGIRKHKIARKKHKTVSSVVYIGKSDKGSKKYAKPKPAKKYDHSPHEVFVELDELFTSEHNEIEWREKARWIKFEEDVEEGADRWGKPHVASLSFNSLLELRKGLENGSLLLDLEAPDLVTIIHRTVESMVIHDQIPSEVKGQVMRTLLMKHKHQRDQLSLMKTLSTANFNSQSNTSLNQLSKENHNNSNNHLAVPKANRSMSMPMGNHAI